MEKKEFEVRWTEYHSVIVKAKDEEEAQEIADTKEPIETRKNVGSEEVSEVEGDDLGSYIKKFYTKKDKD